MLPPALRMHVSVHGSVARCPQNASSLRQERAGHALSKTLLSPKSALARPFELSRSHLLQARSRTPPARALALIPNPDSRSTNTSSPRRVRGSNATPPALAP